MEGIKSFFDSFKEFIWDIIGYLIPGSYIMILLSISIKNKYFLIPSSGTSTDVFYPYIIVIISYLLGYVAYGISRFKEKILGKYSYAVKIENKILAMPAYSISKDLISKSLSVKGITYDLKNATVRDIRSIAMSFIPEQDQKIYTFTFRSDLSNQIGNISIIIGFFGLLFSIFKSIPLDLFETEIKHILLYLCLLIVYFFVRQTRNRFYEISMRLPFSIYTAKATIQ